MEYNILGMELTEGTKHSTVGSLCEIIFYPEKKNMRFITLDLLLYLYTPIHKYTHFTHYLHMPHTQYI